MSKELETLQEIKNSDEYIEFHGGYGEEPQYIPIGEFFEEELFTIEKSLKALEIIKKKQVDVGWFIKCYNDYSNDKDRLMMYNQLSIDDKGRDITKEEFDILKEELL